MSSARRSGARAWRHRVGAAASLLGLATLGVGVAGVTAADASDGVGSGLGAVDVVTTASGLRVPMYSHSGEDVAAESPWSTSSMQTGGVTRSLTSVYWPGDTGGHGGDTLYLLGVPCILTNPGGVLPVDPPCVYQPQQPPPTAYQPLNDPYRAEAQSGRGNGVEDNGGQGVAMHAEAHETDASTVTTMDGSITPASGSQFGKTQTTTKIHVVGPKTVVVDSTSVMHDVSLGGGAVTIDSVTSVAHAVTDTVHARGDAHTTVNGMKVAGVPVTVDEKGLHVQGQGGPLPGTDQLNQALAQSGFKIFVAQPTRTVNGPAISLDSGNLVLLQQQPDYLHQANDTGRILVLGGATIQANAGKGFQFGGFTTPVVTGPGGGVSGGSTGTPGTPGIPGTPGVPATGTSGPTDAPAGDAGAAPVLAGRSATLPSTSTSTWAALCLLGAGLVAFGLRRLPDEVLASTGPSCVLGEQR